MSGFGSNEFEGQEGIEARRIQIQEELRARQNAAASRVGGALGHSGFSTTDRAAFMNSLLAAESAAANAGASPYYAQRAAAAAGAHSPFSRPYGALGSTYGAGHSPSDVASLYARQRAQYGYGGAAASAAERGFHGYGVPGSHEIYSQHFGRSTQEMSLIDRAAAYNAQQRQAENAALLQHTPTSKSPSTPGLATNTLSYMQKESPKLPSPKAPTPRQSPPTPATSAPVSAQPSPPSRTTPQARPRPKPATPMRPPSAEKEKPPISDTTVPTPEGEPIPEGDQKWFSGCVPLGLEDDKYWLSELQVYLRSNFAEAFGATEEDIAAPMHGRNKPIALGQVGIRCMHCKKENPAERGQQATSYPSLISGIYNSVQQMLRLHLDCCQAMPPEVRLKIEQLKLSSSSRGGRKQYWIDSAKRLGLVDTPHGIHFGRDPHGPLPPLTGPSVNSKEGRKKKVAEKKEGSDEEVKVEQPPPPVPQVEERPLVFPEDRPLISDYLYLTLEQMSPCVLMEADRVGCYKTRKVGFPGLACKHCVGQAGCGRYFPASEASLSQTTTSQTIMNHVRNCRRCPIEIRENLEIMKRARMGPDGKRADKPKHGGRKVFFHRLWCRIQGLPIEDFKGDGKEKKKRKKNGKKSKKKSSEDFDSDEDSRSDDDELDDEDGMPPKLTESSEDETETESSSDDSEKEEEEEGEGEGEGEEEEEEEEEEQEEVPAEKEEQEEPIVKSEKAKPKATEKKRTIPWFEGCVRMTKSDDSHWLSDMQCFARSDLVELFTYKKKDALEGYAGRKDPVPGQVGIRCIFCKTLSPNERPSGCIVFPESLSVLHTKVGDMLRLHFHSCPAMPDDTKETFKTLRGFGAKVADDSQQYWIDAGRDIGLSNIPPGGPGVGWGITFRRDPLQPSPSDELDRETAGAPPPTLSKSYLIKPEDRGLCTDQVLLMMRQVKACTFQKKDRRGGPGARGRDRVIDFPGLCCKHCASKNNVGRYFPVSAKNLTDNTANSLQSHISTCSRCPEPIKGSLAFLSHRGILQKAELSGSWKKAFFKKIWDRLHVERAWTSADAEEEEQEDEEEEASVSSEEQPVEVEPPKEPAPTGQTGSDSEDNEEEEEEEIGENMDKLIKAAAIWLTEQDQSIDPGSRNRNARGRALPAAKRSAPLSPRGKSRGTSLTSGKRRRVHF